MTFDTATDIAATIVNFDHKLKVSTQAGPVESGNKVLIQTDILSRYQLDKLLETAGLNQVCITTDFNDRVCFIIY